MKDITVAAVGDLILGIEGQKGVFANVSEILSAADVSIGHIELPHTARPQWSNPEPASNPAAAPENLYELKGSGINVASVGGNHIFDQGENGVVDMLDTLHSLGIATVGGGRNLAEARRPAIIPTEDGRKVAVLQYNAVGPRLAWAAPLKAGCAFVQVSTFYENYWSTPGMPPTCIYTVCDPATTAEMEKDVAAARAEADIVVVAFHMGLIGRPVVLQYQTELAMRAVDAGADVIIGHHAHALHGMSMVRGKPCFWNIGNFVELTNIFDPNAINAPQQQYDPFRSNISMPVSDKAFTKDMLANPARCYSCIAKVRFAADGSVHPSFVPCVQRDGLPVPVSRGNGGDVVFEYLQSWNKAAEIKSEYRWSEDGTEILFE